MEQLELEEKVNSIIDLEEALKMIKSNEDRVSTQNKKVINVVGKQGQLLKNFNDNKFSLKQWVKASLPFILK